MSSSAKLCWLGVHEKRSKVKWWVLSRETYVLILQYQQKASQHHGLTLANEYFSGHEKTYFPICLMELLWANESKKNFQTFFVDVYPPAIIVSKLDNVDHRQQIWRQVKVELLLQSSLLACIAWCCHAVKNRNKLSCTTQSFFSKFSGNLIAGERSTEYNWHACQM